MIRLLLVTGFLLVLATTAGFPGAGSEILILRSGSVSGPSDTAGLPDNLILSVETVAASGGPALLKLDAPATPELRQSLEMRGARWIAPIGDRAALVFVPAGRIDHARSAPGVAWIAPYHPGLRIAPEIAAMTDDDRAEVPVTVQLFADSDVDEVAERLADLGLPVRGRSDGRPAEGRMGERAGRIVLTPTPAQIVAHRTAIASWPEVLWIGKRPTYRLANDDGAWVGQSGLYGDGHTPAFDHGLYGDGQVVGVFDTGLDADMCYFDDPVHGLPPVNEGFGVGTPDPDQRKVMIVNFLWSAESSADPTAWDTQDHGTHVAGTVAGDKLTTPQRRDSGDGMAPAARLVIQDAGYDGDGPCSDLAALGCETSELIPYFDQAYQQGARIHSNSWYGTDDELPVNAYSHFCEDADEFVWNHPDFLIVFAAGNNGGVTETVTSPSTAKNVVSVGATDHGAQAGSVASYSGRGPALDGRVKPDITAPGTGVISADNDGDVTTGNCDDRSWNGTSMATPTVAGFAALVREYFDKGYYPSGEATTPDGFAPSAALLRAGLISSATPMERLAEPPPSDDQGWGRVLLDDVLFFPGDAKHLVVEDVPDRFSSPTDAPDVHEIEILDDSEPLKIVVTWTDYPSTPLATTNLVNDLDLVVTSPTGTDYLGNVFQGGSSQPGGSADRLNNVEVVRVEQPEAGVWTVSIAPHAVPQPPQGYALVASGRTPLQGVGLERTSLTLDDANGGDGDGVIEPGEWVDLPVTLRNVGDTGATNVSVAVESLSTYVEVVVVGSLLPDLAPSASGTSIPAHLRVRMTAGLPCTDSVDLAFTYRADGYERAETISVPTGIKQVIARDDFEGPTGWAHIPGESTATRGDWVIGDPVGTSAQPEDDVTPDPGVNCLYTAPNPTGNDFVDEVANGVVVARSGAYDLSGHPEARLSVWRWWANAEAGNDPTDYFRLYVRQDSGSPDVLLEELDYTINAPRWTEVGFRVADHVQPGATVELRVDASDGYNQGALIESAIDEIVFWEPVCDSWNPAPNPVSDLRLERTADDLVLTWGRPSLDPQHGEAATYRVYRSESVRGGFAIQTEVADQGQPVSWTDANAAGTGSAPMLFYFIIPANEAGDGDALP